MRFRRRVHRYIGVVATAALLAGFAAEVARAHVGWHCYYCGPAWFTPGESHASEYDASCTAHASGLYWDANWMSKSDTALGTIAFIDSSGGWVFSRQTYEINMVYAVSPYNWKKKLLGKNSSSVGYSAELRGYRLAFCV